VFYQVYNFKYFDNTFSNIVVNEADSKIQIVTCDCEMSEM